MSLGLVSELPREDTPGLSVWAHQLLSHFQEGARGSRESPLASRWERTKDQYRTHTRVCIHLQNSKHRKRGRKKGV